MISFKDNKGFTLMEMIIYTAVVSLVILAVAMFAVWTIRLGAKVKLNYALANNGRQAMDSMLFEIKKSKSVYVPTSVFDSDPGQLSLEQKAASVSESTAYVDFFRCGQSLCVKREGESAAVLTGSQVKVDSLMFKKMTNSTSTPSIQIILRLSASSTAVGAEYSGSIDLTNSAVLRSY